jgi:hypothetical protein
MQLEEQRAKAAHMDGQLREELRTAAARLHQVEKELKSCSARQSEASKAKKALASKRAAAQKNKLKVRGGCVGWGGMGWLCGHGWVALWCLSVMGMLRAAPALSHSPVHRPVMSCSLRALMSVSQCLSRQHSAATC